MSGSVSFAGTSGWVPGSPEEIKGQCALSLDEERAIKNLWHEIIHGQTSVYSLLTRRGRVIMETL